MNSTFLFVVLMGAVIGLAVFILLLRDRHRDRIGMPQEARKETEKKLSRGVQAVYFIGEAGVALTAIASVFRKGTFGTLRRDLLSIGAVVAFLWVEWKRWTGSSRSNRKNDVPEIPQVYIDRKLETARGAATDWLAIVGLAGRDSSRGGCGCGDALL